MIAAERAYRMLLRAYPAGFRAEFGREMALVFREQHRECDARAVSFWAATLWDVARSAPQLRLEELRVRLNRDTQTEEGKMKPMAILAILIGAFEAVNALAEGWAGGLVNRDASSLAALSIAVAAGVLLVVTGVRLLRRSSGAAALARGAAVTCMAVFVLITLTQPMLSIFSTIFGIGFPIALLLFLHWTRGREPSVPTTA
jgi:hypothetical protein